jgi:hypothetical protein
LGGDRSGGDRLGEDGSGKNGSVGDGSVRNVSVPKKVAADPSSFNWFTNDILHLTFNLQRSTFPTFNILAFKILTSTFWLSPPPEGGIIP